jgi:N-acetylmuramoyl-L-alanine amidase
VVTRRPALATIVIDPGHGGEDPGVRGAAGSEEKRLTLEVARRLKALVEARLGLRVVLTREDDRALTVDERAAVANNNKADLFLSLHANGAPGGSRAGAEVFFVRLDDEGRAVRGAADAESVVLPVLGGASRRIDVIRWDLAQANHVDESEILATMIAAELQGRVPTATPALQSGLIRVLMGANMPAALVELGYLTNEEQEAAMQSDAFLASAAQALFDSIVRFGEYLQKRPSR